MGKWVNVVRRADAVETACSIRAAVRRWQATMGRAR